MAKIALNGRTDNAASPNPVFHAGSEMQQIQVTVQYPVSVSSPKLRR